MAKYWCVHCQKLVVLVKKRNQMTPLECPFCGAGEFDLFSIARCNIKIFKGAKHGDCIGYPEQTAE